MATKKVLWPWWRQPLGNDLPPDLYSREGRQRTQDWIEASRAREQSEVAAKTTNASHSPLDPHETHQPPQDHYAENLNRSHVVSTPVTSTPKANRAESNKEGLR